MSDLARRLAKLSPAKRQLMQQLLQSGRTGPEPIAIVGMSCRFAGAKNLDAYWELIRSAADATGPIPPSRWDVDAFFDSTGVTPGRMSTRWGGFVDDVDQFDPLFFGISPREAEKMDPQQRLLLEVAWEALEHGGFAADALRGSATGVFVGIGGLDYSRIPIQYDDYFERIDAHSGTGNTLSIAANRLSYVFDFHGPSLAVDTACSSSLVAVHLAIRGLRSGECDMALAGGVNLIVSPETTIAFSKARMLSPDGKCRPFDAAANGYVRGEGCGIVVLKRLTDAQKDGDTILAVLRGSAVNQDGRTSGITAPNALLQQACIRQALDDAELGTEDISYIEGHGTGTPLGDPLEVQALCELFPQSTDTDPPCFLGSVKANVGHTETAAGIAGLAKVVLMLQHGQIPGQPHLRTLNPHISLAGTRLQIAQEVCDWAVEGRQVAGINAFGFGGTNAHLLVEQPPPLERQRGETADRTQHILAVSAKTEHALRQLASSYEQHLKDHPQTSLTDFCHTANAGRSHFHHRAAVIAADTRELSVGLAAVARGERAAGVQQGAARLARRPQVAFLFAGQGAQYPGMARQLFDTQPAFRQDLEQCDQILREFLDRSVLDVMFASSGEASVLDDTLYTQPALFVLEYALAKLWTAWGITPRVVLGHSIGEYAAACYAGVFSLEDGLRLVAGRAQLMHALPAGGAMLIVFAKEADVTPLLEQYPAAVVAAINGPENTVISGDIATIEQLARHFAGRGVRTERLNVSHAFHSPLMEPIFDAFRQLADSVRYHAPDIPIACNLTGALITDRPLDADYWLSHLRQTVRFADGVERVAELAPDAVLEIGPSTTLLAMARRCWREAKCTWVASLRKGLGDWQAIEQAASQLYVRGVNVDWCEFDRPWPRRRLALPSYPFQRSRHWYADGPGGGVRFPQQATESGGHPLLGNQVSTPLPHTLFETALGPHQPHYLADHQLQGTSLTPAAVYIEQALAAAQQAFGPGQHTVENLSIQQAMTLPDGSTRSVQVALADEIKGQCTWETYSRPQTSDPPADQWQLHACGTVRAGSAESPSEAPSVDLQNLQEQTPNVQSTDEFYRQMAARQLVYGPAFQVLDQLRRGDAVALAAVRIPENIGQELDHYHLHPSLLDACLQAMAGVVPLESDGSDSPYTYVPTHVNKVQVWHRPDGPLWVYAVCRSSDDQSSPESVEGDVLLLGPSGSAVARLTGVRIQRLGQPIARGSKQPIRDWAYQIQWQPERPATADSGNGRPRNPSPQHWLVFADVKGIAETLVEQLRSRGEHCCLVIPGAEFSSDEDRTRYTIDPLSAADYDRLIADWRTTDAKGSGILHLWSLDIAEADVTGEAAIETGRRLGCGSALQMLRALGRCESTPAPSLHLVTQGAQVLDDQATPAVFQSPLWGLGRAAANEMPDVQCVLIDLDPAADLTTSGRQLADVLREQSAEQQMLFRDRQRYVARLARAPDVLTADRRTTSLGSPRSAEYRLRLTTPGTFDALVYEPLQRKQPGPGQVEIEVRAGGLNFSDVLKAMGLYPGITDTVVPLGIECSGVVTSVGPGIERFQVGHQVFGVVPYSFASHALSPDYALQIKPAGITHAEACTIPITFLTAHYALRRLAHLQPGERVLIHAGAGGVGLAAVQIAQHVGAEIFATAGSDTKREFLRSLGVQHVMNSRSLDFADEILEITRRQGVDVVLNSLPGEAITKSLSILSAFGRFLEIGKTDIYQNRMIGLLPFQDNLSYFAVDLDRMLRQRPDDVRKLFDEVLSYIDEGSYRPLPHTVFAVDQIVDAFRYMAQRKNVGKVVVDMTPRDTAGPEADPARETIRKDAAYLITGGLGALGMRVAERLVALGARYLLLLSRRQPDAETIAELDTLRAAGAEVLTIEGDVCDRLSFTNAMACVPETFPPLRGVVHAAGVLADGLLHDMDLPQLQRAMAPKVQGAWNLHELTFKERLDFFVLFSSVASLFGSPGQANYAAGNAFLDALARYRTANGLPATSINWGPWGESGMAVRTGEKTASRGVRPLAPDDALELFDAVLQTAPTNIAVMDVHWPELLAQLGGRRTSFLEQFAEHQSEAGTDEELDTQFVLRLQNADRAEREQLLQNFISDEVARVMSIERESLDPDQPLSSFGMDSLIGMELKAQLETQLGLNLPMAALVDSPTITSLSGHAVRALAGPEDSGEVPDEARAEAESPENGIWSPVTVLARDGDALPLFCVHPVGGDVRCYRELARHFAGRRGVYALRPRGLDRPDTTPQSMTDLALDYVQAIRQVRAEGPYHLCGWSTGGIFAYEIARQLKIERQEVGALVFLDTPTPSIFQDVDLDDQARFLFDLVNFSNWFAGTEMRVSYEELKAMTRESAFETLLALGKHHGVLAANLSVEYFHRLIQVCREHVRLIQDYRLEGFGQSVTMFQPEDTSALAEASGQPISGDLGWGNVLGDLLTTQTLPGNHFSLMTGDYVSAVAAQLSKLLEAADGRLLPGA